MRGPESNVRRLDYSFVIIVERCIHSAGLSALTIIDLHTECNRKYCTVNPRPAKGLGERRVGAYFALQSLPAPPFPQPCPAYTERAPSRAQCLLTGTPVAKTSRPRS